MSPEVLLCNGQIYNAKGADVYSIGIIIIELLCRTCDWNDASMILRSNLLARDLCKNMLKMDPLFRINLQEASIHAFFSWQSTETPTAIVVQTVPQSTKPTIDDGLDSFFDDLDNLVKHKPVQKHSLMLHGHQDAINSMEGIDFINMFEDDLLSSQPPSPPGSPSSLPQIYKTPQTMLGDQCQLSPHGLRFATYMSSFTKKNFPRIFNHIERNLVEELTRQLRKDASFETEYISPLANEHQMLCALEYDPGNINFWVKDVHSKKNGDKSTFLSLAKLFDYFFETPTLISQYAYSNWRNTCVNKHN